MDSLERFQCTWLQRQQAITFDRGLWFIFLIGMFPAFYPFARYLDIPYYEIWIPLSLILGVIATHVAVTLRTVQIASKTSLQDSNWEVLALTGISAQKWVCTNWRSVVRKTFAYHIWFALLRLGIALSMAQLLHASSTGNCNYFGLGVFCYQNYIYDGPPYPPIYPLAFKIIMAGLVMVIFSTLEAGLLAAISVGNSVRFCQHLSIGISLLVRGLLVGFSVLSWIVLGNIWNLLLVSRPVYSGMSDIDAARAWAEVRSNVDYLKPIVDNARLVVSIPADNGTLLAADLMRPTWGVLTMVRNLPSIVLGLLVYVGLIRVTLWLAVRQAIRRGMLPEIKRGRSI